MSVPIRLGQAMDGVELRYSLSVGIVIPLLRQRALADIRDHERDVHAAFHHLRQVDLRGQAHGVVAVRREIGGLDIVVRVKL